MFGSMSARNSPNLIAACYVLHRLSVPRHPPNALVMLDPYQKPNPFGVIHHSVRQGTGQGIDLRWGYIGGRDSFFIRPFVPR